MKARELRIGNWLQYDDIPYQATISTFRLLQDDRGIIEKPEPIPLTEEWLLKFGGIEWLEKDENGYYIEIKNKKVYFKFVHSLQNMYFAIESKELK